MLLSVIIPCYNEELVIGETYKRLTNVLDKMENDYELIFINDGSKDKTYEILFQLSAEDKKVKIINFSRNFGHQRAVTAGINNCSGDAAVIIDSDLQDPPEVIVDMLKIMAEQKANVVYGVRKKRKGESWFKLVTAKYFYRFLNSLSDVKFPVDTGDFRLIDRSIIDTFNRMEEKNKYIRGLISWMGYKQLPYYYEREERFAGETKYPFSKMLKLATTSLLYFSTKPLKLATSFGFFSVLIAFILGAWSLLGKFFGFTNADTGWTSLFILIVFFGGVQLITIGIVGAYVGNLFEEIKNRPEYIIKQKKNFGKKADSLTEIPDADS